MHSLAFLQQHFQRFLLTEASMIQDAIVSNPQVGAHERLSIYRDAYQARLVEALSVNYPCLRAWLGDELFNEFAIDYIAAYPSTYRSIRWFGDRVPVFIQDYFEKDDAWLVDLALFEWSMTLVFDARDAPLFSVDAMAHMPTDSWETMCITFHPAVMRISLHWDVVPLWEALTHGLEVPEHVSPHVEPMPWMMWRVDSMIRFRELTPDEFVCIDLLQQGESFGTMCERLCESYAEEEVGLRAAQYLKNWLEVGLIMSCKVI